MNFEEWLRSSPNKRLLEASLPFNKWLTAPFILKLQELLAVRPHLVGDGIVIVGEERPCPEPHLCLHLLVEILVEGGPAPVLADPHDVHQEGEARPLQAAGAPVVVEGSDGRAEWDRFGLDGGVFLGHDSWVGYMAG